MIDGLCNHEECRHFSTFACQRQLPCGHICGGIRDEEVCLPCMQCRKPGRNGNCYSNIFKNLKKHAIILQSSFAFRNE